MPSILFKSLVRGGATCIGCIPVALGTMCFESAARCTPPNSFKAIGASIVLAGSFMMSMSICIDLAQKTEEMLDGMDRRRHHYDFISN